MKIIDVSKQLPFVKSNGTMKKEKIALLVVHHDAMFVPARGYNTMERIKTEAKFHVANGWNHISYHYQIDNLGDVYQCLPETEVGYHAGNYPVNLKSIAVCLHGNFEVQEPTKKQLAALKEFITWITTKRPDLPLIVKGTVKGHRDIKATACPGKNVYKYLPNAKK